MNIAACPELKLLLCHFTNIPYVKLYAKFGFNKKYRTNRSKRHILLDPASMFCRFDFDQILKKNITLSINISLRKNMNMKLIRNEQYYKS